MSSSFYDKASIVLSYLQKSDTTILRMNFYLKTSKKILLEELWFLMLYVCYHFIILWTDRKFLFEQKIETWSFSNSFSSKFRSLERNLVFGLGPETWYTPRKPFLKKFMVTTEFRYESPVNRRNPMERWYRPPFFPRKAGMRC